MVFIWNSSGMFAQPNSSSIYRTFCFVSKKCCKTCFKWQTQSYLKGQVSGKRMNQTLKMSISGIIRLQLLTVLSVNIKMHPNTETVQVSFSFCSSNYSVHLRSWFSSIWGYLIKCDYVAF